MPDTSGGVAPIEAPMSGAQPTSAPTGGDPEQLVMQYWQQNPYAGDVNGLVDYLKQQGLSADFVDHRGSPSIDKIWIGGRMYDVAGHSDDPARRHGVFNDVTDAHFGGGGAPQAGFGVPTFNAPTSGGMPGGGGGVAPMLGMDPQTFGSLLTPWTQQFDPRNPQEIVNDPSYQFQMQEGIGGIQRSAAANGTLLNGGTMKDLMRFNQGLASTFDDKYYNRDLGEYLLGRENFWQNQDRPYNKLMPVAQMGQDAAAANAASGSSYANTVAGALYGQGNASSAGSAASGQNWGDFLGGMGTDWSDYLRRQYGGGY